MAKVKDKRLGRLGRLLCRFRLGPVNAPSRASDVVVSLTSYRARLNGVELTVRSLLAQDCLPARIILFVAEQDMPFVPPSLHVLCGDRFEIRSVDDFKSYKKFIPAMRWLHGCESPYRWLVICDDDIIYPRDWLSAFRLAGRSEHNAVGHRCHVVSYNAKGDFLPYRFWKMNVISPPASVELFATGSGGIAIPFRQVHEHFFTTDAWQTQAPSCDDVWLYYALKCSGVPVVQSDFELSLIEWTPKGSEKLWKVNRIENETGLTPNDHALQVCREHVLSMDFDL